MPATLATCDHAGRPVRLHSLDDRSGSGGIANTARPRRSARSRNSAAFIGDQSFCSCAARAQTLDDAQDLTQGFFAHLIESRAYARADPDKGRFRSFLLGALKHFVAHARAHDRTQKRGGGMVLGQLDTAAIAEADARAGGRAGVER